VFSYSVYWYLYYLYRHIFTSKPNKQSLAAMARLLAYDNVTQCYNIFVNFTDLS